MGAVKNTSQGDLNLLLPEYDLPTYGGERCEYFVCSTPRTGSSLLGDLFFRTGVLGVPYEYLNPVHINTLVDRFGLKRNSAGAVDADVYLERLKSCRTGKNGVLGIKSHFNHAAPFFRSRKFLSWFLTLKHIYITRQDLLGQAISYSRALQSDAWSINSQIKKEPVYDFNNIMQCLDGIISENSNWHKNFAAFGLKPLYITYEELVRDPVEASQRISKFLKPDGSLNFTLDLDNSSLRKQSGGQSKEWRERFVSDVYKMKGLSGDSK